MIETHISWVLLTGEYAYKIKKPVDFGFLDFSTLARRHFFCTEEVRLNRRFAASLYLDVVSVTQSGEIARINGGGDVIEYAVRMHQFPSEQQLDRLLEADRITPTELAEFAGALAEVHASLPACPAGLPFGTAAAAIGPIRENFAQIRQSSFGEVRTELVAALENWSEAQYQRVAPLIDQRRASGFVRECHGDLHLSNLVRLRDGIHAFDCIEFSEGLRWIDLISDIAFLVMDCLVRGRADLAYMFLDRYLERTGDYAGGALLGFYLVYRSMVRAKVAALHAQRSDDVESRRRFDAHLDYAQQRALRARPAMILMCGLSGSGKSWVAQRLIPQLPAVRIRTDVERKRMAGLAPMAGSESPLDAGLYAPQRSDALYAQLARSAGALVSGGERVIVDATFLDAARRETFRAESIRQRVPCVIVHCVAPRSVLLARIEQRSAIHVDPSEATVAVLDMQLANYQPPSASDAMTLTIDTSQPFDLDAAVRAIEALLARAG